MSYQVIARKWRPQTFEEVTGQEIITHTLRNALEHDRLHHAYLFSGSRGVGKTTTARLLAKALNCHKTDGPNLTPCSTAGEMCPSCLEIAESRSMDVLEIDAASHTGIDDVRGTIIEGIGFSPARDRYKVFIIDEVHQLSKAAFNALLKTLEEPPPNVVFIMATTEQHKVPDTILSRCQEFEFRTIAVQKIFERLRFIADEEKIDVSDDALREIARSGKGSMRDAQSNFDQVISFSGEKITSEDVSRSLGIAGVELLTKVVNSISGREPKAALEVVDDLIARGHDLRNFCRDMLGLFRDMLVLKVAGGDTGLFDTAIIEAAELEKLSADFTESDLLRFFNSMAETEGKLREASHSRYVLEIGLVKLIEMRRIQTLETLINRLNAIENGTPTKVAVTPSPPERPVSAATSTPPIEEKKTLKAEPPVDTPRAKPVKAEPDLIEEPPGAFNDEPPAEDDEPPAEEIRVPQNKALFDPSSMPVRLPAISSEELAHVDDVRLDDGYEEKLDLSGDDLMPIADSDDLVAMLLGRNIQTVTVSTGRASGGSSTAAAPAIDMRNFIPADDVDDDAEVPVLPTDPTEDELMAFAKAHPKVRRALKIFRGKIDSVRYAPGGVDPTKNGTETK